jgi:hypothetical protein
VNRRKSLVWVPSRPEAVAEPGEIDFVDGAQHLGDRTLDDLVLQRRHAERSLPAIVFGNEDAPNRLWPVVLGVDARAEIPEIAFQILLVHFVTVIPSTPALACLFCRRNARSSATMST